MIDHRFACALCKDVAAALLAGCSGSQPKKGAPSTAVQPATHVRAKFFHRYYPAKFNDEVGYPIPSRLCVCGLHPLALGTLCRRTRLTERTLLRLMRLR